MLNILTGIVLKFITFVKKVFNSMNSSFSEEVEELKERISTITTANVAKHVGHGVQHFFITALITAGLTKLSNPLVSKIKEHISLPMEDCLIKSDSGITAAPLRLGFRILERIYDTLMYDSKPTFLTFRL